MPTQRATGASRAAIVSSGYAAISELGYHAATTAEICRRADVSSGTFFHHFPTKEDLLLEILGGGAAGTGAVSVVELVDEVLNGLADPLLPAFVQEVSTLARLPRVHQALSGQAEIRRFRLLQAVRSGQEVGTVRDDLQPADVVYRVEIVIEGVESLAATRQDLDLAVVADVVRALVADAVGQRRA